MFNNLQKIFAEVVHKIKLFMLGSEVDKQLKKQVLVDVSNSKISYETKKVETYIKDYEKNTVNSALEVVKGTTEEERLFKMLNVFLDQILIQIYKASENTELNPIHPEFAPYILTMGAGFASEKTEEKIQRLAKEKDRRYALLYLQEALSAQWRVKYSYLIKEAGKYVSLANGYSQLRANLKELGAQTFWSDRKFFDEFMVKHLISEPEFEEFLFALANDKYEFLLESDTDTETRKKQTR